MINITATYDDDIGASSALTVVFNNGVSIPVSNVSGATITADYTVGATGSLQDVTNLDVASITVQTTEDAAGNALTSTVMPGVNLTTASAVNVDTTAPVLLSFTSSTADGTYGPGSTINVTATYDQALGAGSTVDVNFNNTATLTLSSVAGSTISGTYTVGATGSGEDIVTLDVASISSQAAVDLFDNTNSSTALPATTIATASSIDVDTTALSLIALLQLLPMELMVPRQQSM